MVGVFVVLDKVSTWEYTFDHQKKSEELCKKEMDELVDKKLVDAYTFTG